MDEKLFCHVECCIGLNISGSKNSSLEVSSGSKAVLSLFALWLGVLIMLKWSKLTDFTCFCWGYFVISLCCNHNRDIFHLACGGRLNLYLCLSFNYLCCSLQFRSSVLNQMKTLLWIWILHSGETICSRFLAVTLWKGSELDSGSDKSRGQNGVDFYWFA